MDASVLTDLSGAQMARLIASKEISPVELANAYIDRIDRLNPKVNAYVTVCQEEALANARHAEEAVLRGDPLQPLHGLPLAAKDQFDTKGVTTTSGSRSLSANVPPEDATVVARTKAAGAVLIGKTSMTQFASGLGDRWQFGEPPRNPWDLERDTIGSSNGSAIAIAASMCAISLGEDTGGSIRCPSSATGAVGFRPTWGRLSRYRMHGLSWSMDSAGPITRSVEDAALMLNAIAGYDPKDTLTSKRPVPDYTQGLGQDIKGKRIGLIQEFMDPEFCEPQVVEAVTAAAKHLESLGATVEEVSLPMLRDARLIASPVTGSDAGPRPRGEPARAPGTLWAKPASAPHRRPADTGAYPPDRHPRPGDHAPRVAETAESLSRADSPDADVHPGEDPLRQARHRAGAGPRAFRHGHG